MDPPRTSRQVKRMARVPCLNIRMRDVFHRRLFQPLRQLPFVQRFSSTFRCLYLNYDNSSHHTLLCEYIDLSVGKPTFVIPDSGCTRAMSSLYAMDRLVRACWNHPNGDLVYFTKEPSQSRFSFANGQQSSVRDRLVA